MQRHYLFRREVLEAKTMRGRADTSTVVKTTPESQRGANFRFRENAAGRRQLQYFAAQHSESTMPAFVKIRRVVSANFRQDNLVVLV